MKIIQSRDLPPVPGAYALIITLNENIAGLQSGRFLYAGNADGPGGIRARVRRHMKPAKTIHWHVDRLTNSGQVTSVIPIPDGQECAIVSRVLGLPGVKAPLPGFGSSDCRVCPAHLLRLPDRLKAPDIFRAILETR